MCHQTNLLAVELASWGLSVNDDKLHFCYLKQSRERGLTSTQGDLNFGASSQADFILNYFLSKFLNFPLKFSISSQPGWQAGAIKVTLLQQTLEPAMAIAVKTAFWSSSCKFIRDEGAAHLFFFSKFGEKNNPRDLDGQK